MIGRTNAGGKTGQYIVVTLGDHEQGITVRAVGSNLGTFTAVSNSAGQATIEVKKAGTYTISATSDYVTATITIDGAGALILNTAKFGYAFARIDTTNPSPSGSVEYPASVTLNGITYANSCYGFTKASGTGADCLGSDWSNHRLLATVKPVVSDGASSPTFTDAPRNPSSWVTGSEYFTQFDHTFYTITTVGDYIYVGVTDDSVNPDPTIWNDDAFLGVDGLTSKSRFLIGCFYSSGDSTGTFSKASTGAWHDTTANLIRFCKGANARGANYDVMSIKQWTYIQILFVLIYGSLDYQTAHSKGICKTTYYIDDANTPRACTNDFGMYGSTANDETNSVFLWIHDAVGNMGQFVGGLFVRAGSTQAMYYSLSRTATSTAFDNDAWNETNKAKQSNMGQSVGADSTASSNYPIKTVYGDRAGGFLPKTANATWSASNQYFSDGAQIYTNANQAYFAQVGGSINSGDRVGIFMCQITLYSNDVSTVCASRLAYRA